MTEENEFIYIVLREGPGPESDFVEVEDDAGRSIRIGEWVRYGNGCVGLKIPDPRRAAVLDGLPCDQCPIHEHADCRLLRAIAKEAHGE